MDTDNQQQPLVLTENIKSSVLYSDFQKYGYLPDIDTLLDWRSRLNERKSDDVLNPPSFYDNEISAVDYLLYLKNAGG